MKNFYNAIAVFFLSCLVFFGCSNQIDDSKSMAFILSSQTSSKQAYGSLVVNEGDSRSLVLSEITRATVTVSGYGMNDITESVNLTNGGGRIEIQNIPVGKNRIVSVQAFNGTALLNGAVIRCVTDINEGPNSADVNWETTPLGNVFNELLKLEVDIGAYDSAKIEEIKSKIPAVHASLVDAAKIASDLKNEISSGDYVLDYGTVKVNAENAAGFSVQVTDVSSEKKTVSVASESFELKAFPGSWKVIVYDSSNEKVAEKNILVVSGKESEANISCSASSVDFSGKTIIFVKASSAPCIWAWEDKGTELSKAADGTWNKSSDATKMVAATTEFMADPSGWYMIDYSSYATGKNIKFKLNWDGDEISGNAGTFWYDGNSVTSENPSPISSGELRANLSVKNPDVPVAGLKMYVSASTAPSIWVWQPGGKETTKLMGYTWNSQPTMENAQDLNFNENWYVFEIGSEYYVSGKEFSFILNSGSTEISSGKSASFWYDDAGVSGAKGTFYDEDPTKKPEPEEPTVTIKPTDGSKVKTTGSISVTFTDGFDTISDAKVTINGEEYNMGTTAGTFSKTLEDLGITEDGVKISVSATVTNGVGPASANASFTSRYVDPSKEDPFTWDNVNAYFVLTDRFYNGDSSNDHSYFRKNDLVGDENVATFHGGDLAGLTQKLDYFDKLGVNAIWITAPYEQAHGWVGGKNGAFPHYAFHGYYTLDWSSMDQNMGTVEELREFVNACHSKGIRVIMDVVMNHVGYNNTQDMITFKHGYTEHTDGWLAKTAGKWDANDTVKWDNSYWDDSWFGPWIRSFGYASGSEYGGSCGGLPDVKTELTSSVGIAPVHNTKWNKVDTVDYKSKYYNPSVAETDWLEKNGDYRTDMNVAPADYQVAWLSAWVREVGIDGFRCDTAKHVEPFRWGQLKVACTAALEAWRNDSTKDKTYNGKDTGAADWDESFWMTGECFGWTSTAGQGDYYTTGKFDSMINFSFNGSAGPGTSSNYPDSSTWSSYLSINNNGDSDNNGNRNNVLTYLSSHDTKLCRPSDAYAQGTMFTLLPGGIQIYYGDESSRPVAYTGCGDTDMMTRGDMNWTEIEGLKADQVAHWGKVGNFRKYNPAVGAGTGTATKRTYSGPAGENKVAIGINGTSVDVQNLFADGSTVYNWYDGKSATVSGGSVTFAGGTTTQPILVSDKNPATCGIAF